jgi:hypothetical protein
MEGFGKVKHTEEEWFGFWGRNRDWQYKQIETHCYEWDGLGNGI